MAALAYPVWAVVVHFVLPRSLAWVSRQFVGELGLLAITLAIVIWARWWRQSGLVGPWRHRWWTLLLAGLGALNLLLGVPGLVMHGDAARLPAVLPLVALVGLCEETLNRGVMLYGLSRFGPLVAGLSTAVIFGASHVGNAFQGLPVSYVIVQMIQAMLLGLLFAGLRFRMVSLWPLIVAHAAYDVPALLEGFPQHVGPVGLGAAIFAIWTLVPFGAAGLSLLIWEQLTARELLLSLDREDAGRTRS
jgi:membrane protease YdiL (CAAX protease family)